MPSVQHAVGLVLAAVLIAGCDDAGSDGLRGVQPEFVEDDEGAASTGEPVDHDAPPLGAAADAQKVYDCDFTEDFEGPNGDPWPSPWIEMGPVETADLRNGRGRIRVGPSSYAVARMFAPLDCQDFDATVTVMFTDTSSQGAGLYGRQNGGYLQQTMPRGRGYAAFVENFRNPVGVGLWRELGGIEQDIVIEEFAFAPEVEYRLRLRIKQLSALETMLGAKMWPLGEPEPEAWTVETIDDAASLQKRAGGVALDAYTAFEGGTEFDVYFDDLVVTRAIDPAPELGFSY